ncbi:MAG: NERD domain-containing protein [Kiritimatiellae bacterium]|nr:NERD domain-containing protein [Kiritimatiellia bacterium]
MSFITCFNLVLCPIALLLVAACLWLRTKHAKGVLGEFAGKLAVKQWLPESGYELFSDVMLQDKRGTTQIDHVVVSRFGIFVIEAKGISGKLYASSETKYRTWKVYRNGRGYTFQNPYLQNYRHRCALSEVLDVPLDALHDVIFFPHEDLVLATPEKVAASFVTGRRKLAEYILSFKEQRFTAEEVARLAAILNLKRMENSHENKKKHTADLKARWEKKS